MATETPGIIKVANYKIIVMFIAIDFIFNIKAGLYLAKKTIQHQ